jgi:Fe-S-cluster formation regulator IscX/YfhJ
MSNYPDSGHWADKERFYSFVKTICRYNARKWKDTSYLKKRILERMPHFDPKYLDYLQDLFMQLIDFHKIPPLRSIGITEGPSTAESNCYIERQVKDGQIIERLKASNLGINNNDQDKE